MPDNGGKRDAAWRINSGPSAKAGTSRSTGAALMHIGGWCCIWAVKELAAVGTATRALWQPGGCQSSIRFDIQSSIEPHIIHITASHQSTTNTNDSRFSVSSEHYQPSSPPLSSLSLPGRPYPHRPQNGGRRLEPAPRSPEACQNRPSKG